MLEESASMNVARCCRVLVVEDNPIHQVVVSSMLRKIGVVADMVESAEAALAAWESGAYGIILMDVHLPGMDGVSATRTLREREASRALQRKTPVVAMTASATPEELEVFRSCGMTGYIGKPLDEARVVKALVTWGQV